ncbi:hypothetical protein K438DRAFT_1969983 [Mycena galopus ATCC 62051]|nr:hypothetical protein K438DRAFT_1969983 [Mycena galopus ATCC 62051]
MASTASSSRGKKRAAPTTEVLDWTLDDILEGASFTSQHVSEDKQQTYEKVHIVDLPSPLKKKQQNVAPAPFSHIGNGFEYVFEDLMPPERIAPPNRAVKARAKRYLSSDAPLAQWVHLRDQYLAEFIRLEGRGHVAHDSCPACLGETCAGGLWVKSTTMQIRQAECNEEVRSSSGFTNPETNTNP